MALPVNGSTHLIPAYYSIYRPRKDERLSWPSERLSRPRECGMIIVTKCSFAVGLVTSVTLCLPLCLFCFSVCARACLKRNVQTLPNFRCLWPWPGPFFGEVTIRYVLPVFFHIMPNSDNPERPFVNRAYTVLYVTRQGRQVQWGGAESAVYGCCAVRRCGVRGG